MRRFEFKDSRSYKFWEIEVEGDSYTVRYGKVGSKGATSSKSFATPAKAAADAEKKIKSKTRKGYAEVAVAAPAPAPAPTSAGDWAVRADALEAAGDPWGERISVFMRWDAAAGADKRTFKKRLGELDDAHGEHYYGEALLELMSAEYDTLEQTAKFEWSHGFISEARVATTYNHSGPSAKDTLAALEASPASKYMTKLVVGRVADYSDDYSECLTVIGRGGFESLEYLFVGDFEYPDDTEISWVSIGDLGQALAGLPALSTLRARGGGALMSNFNHAKLRRLEIESGGLPGAGLRGLAKGDLPELAHVSLWLGTDDYGGSTDVSDLDALWSTKTMPKLSHLGLQNSIMQDDIAAALVEAEILEQLSSVDLSMGTMRERGAKALVDNIDRLEHLESLNVDDNFIPDDRLEQLRAGLGDVVQLGYQRTPEDWDDDEAYYYTSVSE